MKFVEAFRKLGYEVQSPRQHWSALNDDGVCITLWQKELEGHMNFYDTKLHADPLEEWLAKPGNTKRKEHLEKVVKDHDGLCDVVIVNGIPGQGYGDAHPWEIKMRGARWRVVNFEPDTGHFRVELERL